MECSSYMHLSLFKSRSNDLFSLDYANELLGGYVTCVFTIYLYMLLCKISNLSSNEPLHGFCFEFGVDVACVSPNQDR